MLEAACPDCGYDPAAIDVAAIPSLVRDNAASWVAVLARPDVRASAAAGRVVAARVRLPRARRLPPVRHPPAPDARRGRPAVRQLGPGRHGARRALLGAGPGRRRRRVGGVRRRRRGVVRRGRRASSGSARAGAATAPASRSSRSGATSSTTGCTTPGTSARPEPDGRIRQLFAVAATRWPSSAESWRRCLQTRRSRESARTPGLTRVSSSAMPPASLTCSLFGIDLSGCRRRCASGKPRAPGDHVVWRRAGTGPRRHPAGDHT